MTKAINNPASFLKAFREKFSSTEHNRFHIFIDDEGNPTTGEGSDLPNGLPIYNPYHDEEMAGMAEEFGMTHTPTYNCGVAPEVDQFCESVGWRAEPFDCGTLKFYKD